MRARASSAVETDEIPDLDTTDQPPAVSQKDKLKGVRFLSNLLALIGATVVAARDPFEALYRTNSRVAKEGKCFDWAICSGVKPVRCTIVNTIAAFVWLYGDLITDLGYEIAKFGVAQAIEVARVLFEDEYGKPAKNDPTAWSHGAAFSDHDFFELEYAEGIIVWAANLQAGATQWDTLRSQWRKYGNFSLMMHERGVTIAALTELNATSLDFLEAVFQDTKYEVRAIATSDIEFFAFVFDKTAVSVAGEIQLIEGPLLCAECNRLPAMMGFKTLGESFRSCRKQRGASSELCRAKILESSSGIAARVSGGGSPARNGSPPKTLNK